MKGIRFKNTQFSTMWLTRLGVLWLVFLLFASVVKHQEPKSTMPPNWAQATLNSMTLRQKIGQLFMVAAFSNKTAAHTQEIKQLITEHQIGGLIFFQGGPYRQARLNNEYQKLSKIPLFMAMDAEWGLAMRLDSTVQYPRQMVLGAIRDQQLIYQMGKQIALQSRRIGMQINFAPVVDVNVNALNPVIGTRSFGENKYQVAQRAAMYMKGMQDQYVLANAKHFPGHGDTDTDSHLALPVIKHDTNRLKEIELYPFAELFKQGLKSVMVAHIHIPALDATPNRATTLSPAVVTKLLKEKMGFEGLAFTDALNMNGVANYYAPGQTDLLALKAGNDVLLYPMDVPKAINAIEAGIKKGEITLEDLDRHVLKILEAKQWSQIESTTQVNLKGLYEDLNLEEYEALNYKLRESALTLLKMNSTFPLELARGQRVLSVSVGSPADVFDQHLEEYTQVDRISVSKTEVTSSFISKLKTKLKTYDYVVLSINGLNNQTRQSFGVNQGLRNLISQVASQPNVITCHYGNAYSLGDFYDCSNLVAAYEYHPYAQQAMAQAVVGALKINGQIPVSSGEFKQGDGIALESHGVIGFDFPSNVGMDYSTLLKIDSIVQEALANKATPGCQVLVAKGGKIIYDKGFGCTFYSGDCQAVNHGTIYDLASVTKVLSTGMALMKLSEEGRFDLNATLDTYLPELESTNKGDLVIRNILAHQAGLKPYIAYWAKTVDKNELDPVLYSTKKSQEYPVTVAEGIYAKPSIKDSIYHWSNESELLSPNTDGSYPYRYSDVGYYYMQRIIEKITGQPLDDYLITQAYSKMSLHNFAYNPLAEHDKTQIAPTEKDEYFRNQLIQGYVHDQGSSMMGGVAGHAGLFSNSFDIAQILQMFLNEGTYNGYRLLKPETIKEFTSKQLEGDNRKGATWDRMRPEGRGPSSDYASPSSYGHSGFTGTLIWVDPEYDLLYVFLSNRVHPDASNPILSRTDVRTKIQDVIYQSILNFNAQHRIY